MSCWYILPTMEWPNKNKGMLVCFCFMICVLNYISHIYLEIINTHSLTTAVPMTN